MKMMHNTFFSTILLFGIRLEDEFSVSLNAVKKRSVIRLGKKINELKTPLRIMKIY